ncbi:MAG: hypothetical protein WC942_01405, partial [Clostridia bacterium]
RRSSDLATAALYNLQKLSETFIEPQEKRDSLKAATIILDDLKKEIGKLSPALQDKFNKIYQKSIQGELVKIPKPYTSPFRAPKDIFIQNRINLIFKTHEGIDRIDRDAGLKQASQIAQQEWDQISTIINTIIKQELGDNVPAEKIRTIQQTFINQILGGSSIEDTEKFIRLYVKIGDKYEDIFSDIDYKEEGSVENAIFILTDKEKIEDELSEIPQSQALLVGKNIYDFGILCKKVIDTEANMLDMPSDESVAELKDLYFETSALGQKLLTIPEKLLKEIELFEWIYILRKNLLDLFSKYDFDSDNITYDPGEIKDFKQVGKEPRKALDPDKVRSPRDPTAEAEARKRYEEGTEELRRPLVRQRARERLKRPDVEEHRDVVGSDYRNIKTEINKWKSFATRSDVTQRDIDTLKRTHLQKTIDLFVRIKGSWLSKPELEKVILDLYENRVKSFSEAINSISSGNEFVINQLKQHFNSLSSYIKSAATKADTIDVVKKNPPNDIDWPRIQSLTELKLPQETPGDVVKRLPKVSPIKRALYLVDVFFKYAML